MLPRNDCRHLSQLTHSSALGNVGILYNAIQIKSNVPANYRTYFPFLHTHLQLNHRFLFYCLLGIKRVSGKFNYLSGRYCSLTTHATVPDSIYFLFYSAVRELSVFPSASILLVLV